MKKKSRLSPRGSPSRLPVRRKRKAPEEVSPKSEIEEFKIITFSMSTLFTIGISEITITPSNSFSTLNPKEINRVFAEKCKECMKICDFSMGIKDKAAKQTKRTLLGHFAEIFDSPALLRFVTPANIKRFISMVIDNISRPFPSMLKITAFDFGDQMEDLAWPHLQLVYRAAVRLFNSNIAICVEGGNLLSVLVSNCCSPDVRERMACRDVLQSVYKKCEANRAQIVRFIHNQFLTLICSKELLEFYVVIVDELPLPLSEDALRMFRECVLILHSSHLFLRFCFTLLQVLDHYIKVDSDLLAPTIDYICRHWPTATVRKQVIFLSEVEGLVMCYSNIISPEIAELLFRQMAKLVNVPNVEIAEATLNLILGDSCSQMIVDNAEMAMKTLLEPLWSAARKNWNELVREDAEFCLRMLNQLDEPLFKAEVSVMRATQKQRKAEKQICKTHWEKIFELAKSNDRSIRKVNLVSML
jgi:hypothetical protein